MHDRRFGCEHCSSLRQDQVSHRARGEPRLEADVLYGLTVQVPGAKLCTHFFMGFCNLQACGYGGAVFFTERCSKVVHFIEFD